MTLNCSNINLKKGSKGDQVREAQTILKKLGHYTGVVDGDYGTLTETAVKQYQKKKGTLAVDGIIGPVTCKKLNNDNDNGIYTVTHLCEKSGGNCLGQITAYHCGPHCIKQCLRKFGITGYTEQTIGGYAGTTSAGTGHYGLETAIATIARKEGIKLKVTWKNFSELGNTNNERFKKLGQLATSPNTVVFWHELYRGQYGHYSLAKTVNTNNNTLIVANSLGNKCNSPAYCGYLETRGYTTQNSYYRGISQKSICIITKE